MTTQPTLENWEMKARRVAQEIKTAIPDPFTSTRKQREHYAHLRYALQVHLEAVPT